MGEDWRELDLRADEEYIRDLLEAFFSEQQGRLPGEWLIRDVELAYKSTESPISDASGVIPLGSVLIGSPDGQQYLVEVVILVGIVHVFYSQVPHAGNTYESI